AGDIVLRPAVRGQTGPAVPGQVRRDDAHTVGRVSEQVAVDVVMLRPTVQRDHRRAGSRFGDVETHSPGHHRAAMHSRDLWDRRLRATGPRAAKKARTNRGRE